MKKINLLLIVYFFLLSCGGLKDAGKVLRNEKIRTTDEFLVKKRNPLVLPPNFEEIPEPGSISKNKESDKEKIKKILKISEDNLSKDKSSSIEKSILNKIRK
ncbi:DUF3035 domain-containing protein [Pelagibacterales bacterium SAG-MED28]|nr:DUF3035 domain-containing protein [Pelagibacterales bacterium SAG-MED28]|tara:strand:+ start:559 stop:864 length:306 start_codon:yes stop_codon:yes gene_type:complete